MVLCLALPSCHTTGYSQPQKHPAIVRKIWTSLKLTRAGTWTSQDPLPPPHLQLWLLLVVAVLRGSSKPDCSIFDLYFLSPKKQKCCPIANDKQMHMQIHAPEFSFILHEGGLCNLPQGAMSSPRPCTPGSWVDAKYRRLQNSVHFPQDLVSYAKMFQLPRPGNAMTTASGRFPQGSPRDQRRSEGRRRQGIAFPAGSVEPVLSLLRRTKGCGKLAHWEVGHHQAASPALPSDRGWKWALPHPRYQILRWNLLGEAGGI